MNCQEAHYLLDAEALTATQHASIQQHLGNCPACRAQWSVWREVAALPVPAMPASLRGGVLAALPVRGRAPRRPVRLYLVTGLFVMGVAAAALVVQQVNTRSAVAEPAEADSASASMRDSESAVAASTGLPVAAVEQPIATAPPSTARMPALQPAPAALVREAVALPPTRPTAAAPLPAPQTPTRIAAAASQNAPHRPGVEPVAAEKAFEPGAIPGASTPQVRVEHYEDWPAIKSLAREVADNHAAGLELLEAWSALATACPDFKRTTPQTQLANRCRDLTEVLLSRAPVVFWSACLRRTRAYNKLARRFAEAMPEAFADRARVGRALDTTRLLLSDYCVTSAYPQRFPKVIDVIRRAEILDQVTPSVELSPQFGALGENFQPLPR